MTSSVATRAGVWRPLRRPRFDSQALAIWALAGGLVLYLALNDGGYDLVVRSDAGVVVWWIVLVGAAFGVFPAARLTRAAWIALVLLGGFVAWTALASTWSLSSERSLQQLSLVAGYLGVLVLALMSYGDRRDAMAHAIAAVASVVVIVAVLALLSRLRPETFPAARTALSFLGGADGRLSWPLNYWNALAALMALGLPLLLSIATSARNLLAQAAAAGAIPLAALVGYLTFSRGGAIEGAVALIVFVALAPSRLPKLATLLVCAGGAAALIAGAVHRPAVDHGLTTSVARSEGTTLLVAVVLVCAGVAVVQLGFGLLARHASAPKWLRITRRQATVALVGALAAGVIAALAIGAPGRVSHLWTDFKQGTPASAPRNGLARFATTGGNGRYTYWKVAIDASSGHPLTGSGPGTFQLLWLPRAPFESYVINAHSLYVETYAEVGLIGLILLLAFFVTILGVTAHRVARGDPDTRTRAAAIGAAWTAFLVAAAFDWVWQMAVLPVAILLLGAGVLAPTRRQMAVASKRGVRAATRVVVAVLAVASLAAIGVPLATASAVLRSQAAVSAGNTNAALSDARAATGLEPGASTPQLQAALVLELRRQLSSAVAFARKATRTSRRTGKPGSCCHGWRPSPAMRTPPLSRTSVRVPRTRDHLYSHSDRLHRPRKRPFPTRAGAGSTAGG